MSKARKNIAILGGTPDEVEALFYEALQAGDVERLMSCWAEEDDIACIHPGGPRVVGLGAIRNAFESLFSNGGSVQARPEHIRRVDSLASAVHSVLERVEVLTADGPGQAYVIATNVYHKTPQGWRMVVHHASPGTAGEAQEIHQSAQVLH
jgi:ketosteroid isomerase-like protein